MFALQLDESTDIASCSQRLVFVRYMCTGCQRREEILTCAALETTTKTQDAVDKISAFIETEGHQAVFGYTKERYVRQLFSVMKLR